MLNHLYTVTIRALTGLDQLDREDGGGWPSDRRPAGAENHDIAPQVTGAAA